jgi:von Willebrand factor type A domain
MNGRLHMKIFLTIAMCCISSFAIAGNNVVIVLDDSGSMKDRMRTSQGRIPKIDAAKQALSQVLARLPEDTQLGVMLLNGAKQSNNWLIPLGPLNAAQANQRIQSIRADGGTPLGEKVQSGMDELLRLRAKLIYGTYRLIVVTDGEATDKDRLTRVLPGVLSRGIAVDVIGVDMAKEHSLATQVHSYRRADDAASFTKAISDILAESTATGDGADSDFDLIASLPDGLASEALTALSKPNNAAVSLDENPLKVATESGLQTSSPATVSAPSPSPPTPTYTADGSIIGTLLSGMCCMAIFGVVLIIVMVTILKSKRR